MNGQYEDIIHLPHHVSEKRPRMSMLDRAAQFSPFAALTGYGSAIEETVRLTDRQIELSDDRIEALDAVLRVVEKHIRQRPEVEIRYFKPDMKKAGGAYLTVSGNVKKIDSIEGKVVFVDGTEIPILDIVDIRCDELRVSSDSDSTF